ncbi:S8 family peptidase [Enterococcus sp. 669A]|uniref:S8 family peptidase n=1 Tax=Candidatus Enterococcus moelleringii TaxID=2815325 RepID=A0ABS3LFU3_9ENTE|nr:S8 family peptidase [Enterococcus sp. 669A]MBO1307935.1 S8 family peptidase [Enterococcus sp. 669A]
MADDKKNPLIINGLSLAQIGETPKRGGDLNEFKKWRRTLSQARIHLKTRLEGVQQELQNLPEEYKLSNYYLRIDYPSDFLAKSYQVNSIYNDAKLDLIGSNIWIDDNEKTGRSDYLRGTDENLVLLMNLIENTSIKVQKREICRMEDIQLLKPIMFTNDFIEEGFYELAFHAVTSLEELLKKLEVLLAINSNDYTFQAFENNVVFVYLCVTEEMYKKIEKFNPLRSVYPAGNRDYTGGSGGFETTVNNKKIGVLTRDIINQLPWVGLIDGGVSTEEAFFQTVTQLHEVEEKASLGLVEHGSSVASILLYGDLNDQTDSEITPDFRVFSVRALPSEKDVEFNLISLEKLIEEVIPVNTHIKVWNLSIGPQGPILDEVVSSLTRLLDMLAYKHDVIFVIAAGNTGEYQGIARRIQIPADSVNNITVSSHYRKFGKNIPAPYNSIEPGREGGKLKPDIIDRGGLGHVDPVYTISTYGYLKNKVEGTSFAAPQVSRKLASIMNMYPEISTLKARALLEHSIALQIEKERPISIYAKGELKDNEYQLLQSNNDEIRVMYSGQISAKGYVVLPIPIPDDVEAKMIEFTWTVVTKTKVNPDFPDRYTEYTVEDDFYPNSHKYKYKGANSQTVILDLSEEDHQNEAEKLLENGYKKSSYPNKDNPKYLTEEARRKDQLKWDTLKTQKLRKQRSSVNEPFLRLHGLSRSESRDRIEYVAVVTVKFKGDEEVLAKVLQKYPVLQTIAVRERTQQRI